MKDDLVSSALILSKKKQSKKDEHTKSIYLIDHRLNAFQFKEREVPKGQYRLPFSFKLPIGLPGSFKLQQSNGKKRSIMIEYTIEVYMEIILKDGKPPIRVGHKKEIDVREFLFTNEEVSEDWSNY